MRRDIAELSFEISLTSPVVQRMKGRPEHPEWRRLSQFGERPELAAFRESLSALVQDAFQTGAELFRLAKAGPTDRIAAIPYANWNCRSAAQLAEAAAEESPGAALLLAIVAVIAWSRSATDLYGDHSKTLDEGWSVMPHACAVAGVRAKAFQATLALIDQAYDVVHSITASYQYHHPTLSKYRRVARLATEAYEGCIRDLADDLRDACSGDPMENFRPEFCALLWALGYAQPAAVPAGGSKVDPEPCPRPADAVHLARHAGPRPFRPPPT